MRLDTTQITTSPEGLRRFDRPAIIAMSGSPSQPLALGATTLQDFQRSTTTSKFSRSAASGARLGLGPGRWITVYCPCALLANQ